jgi:hypothetical protein
MDEKKLKHWRRGFKAGAKREAAPKEERYFQKVWGKVESLNTFEAELLGEVAGLNYRMGAIEALAGF